MSSEEPGERKNIPKFFPQSSLLTPHYCFSFPSPLATGYSLLLFNFHFFITMSNRYQKAQEALQRTEAEIKKEKAEALGRSGDRLGEALKTLLTLEQELDAKLKSARERGMPASARREINQDIEVFNKKREEVLQFRYYLIVHREALGLRKHTEVDRLFPIPKKRELLK